MGKANVSNVIVATLAIFSTTLCLSCKETFLAQSRFRCYFRAFKFEALRSSPASRSRGRRTCAVFGGFQCSGRTFSAIRALTQVIADRRKIAWPSAGLV